MDDDEYELHKRAIAESNVNALAAVLAMDLPREIVLSDHSFSGLGTQVARTACSLLSELKKQHAENTPELIGIALREIAFALHAGAGYTAAAIGAGIMGDNEYTRGFATPQGYGEKQGLAWALHEHVGLPEPDHSIAFREGTRFRSGLPLSDILRGAAVYWFAKAAELRRSGDVDGALDLVHEAQEALNLIHGNRMWEEGHKQGSEPDAIESSAQAAARVILAREAARARHAADPRQSERLAVKECWKLWQQDPSRYSGKAAFARDMLQKFEALKSEAVIAGWCRDWEREHKE